MASRNSASAQYDTKADSTSLTPMAYSDLWLSNLQPDFSSKLTCSFSEPDQNTLFANAQYLSIIPQMTDLLMLLL